MKDYKSVVTVDDTAYELYTYLDKVADNYAKSVNKVADTLAGKSDVYDLVIPLSSGITFPDNLKDKISSSDQHDAMQKIQAKMDKHVKNVDVYDVLMQHRTEYEYFRTDHHWTTLAEAAASNVKQGQYSPRKRKDTTPFQFFNKIFCHRI